MLRDGSSKEVKWELGELKPGDLLYITVTIINKTVFYTYRLLYSRLLQIVKSGFLVFCHTKNSL